MGLHWETLVTQGEGTLRDCSSYVIATFSTYYGHCTSLEVEERVLLEGVILCNSHGCLWVLVEMDSKVLLDVLQGRAKCPWNIDRFICQIKTSSQHRVFCFSHGFKEVNSAADALAHLAKSNRASASYRSHNLPRHVKGIVSLDRAQFPYLHVSWSCTLSFIINKI